MAILLVRKAYNAGALIIYYHYYVGREEAKANSK